MNPTMRRKHTYREATSQDRFWSYLFGKISKQEQHAFEKQMLNDPFEAEALEGFSQLNETDFADDLNLLHNNINSTYGKKTNSRNIWLVAATVTLVVGIVSILTLLIPSTPPTLSDNLEMKPKQETVLPAIKPIAKEKAPSQKSEETIEVASDEEIFSEELAIQAPETTKQEKKFTAVPEAKKGQQGLIMERIKADKEDIIIQKDKTVGAAPVMIARSDAAIRRKKAQPARELSGTLRGQKLTDTATGYDDVIVIKGVVMDENQEPVPGANVLLKGTSKGTITQMDGSYKLAVNRRDSSKPIMAGFIGYVSSEKSQSTDSLNFMLEPELLALDEVVVSGYGTERERKIVTEDFVPAQPEVEIEEYIKSIERTLEYPAIGSGKKETVVVRMTISDQGTITDIKIKRSPGEAYSFEVVKKLRSGPTWLPATQNGIPVEDKIKLKLQFLPD
ncbi:MAG: carboxypeptidase-like regulatory domain-containing protein [Marinilabiliaceae bacterium]|nr:carboxypeptidase-like regulatory domain-containing protein [Marinilabiliaceae bacterium]